MTCEYNRSLLPERILNKIEVDANGCWRWLAGKDRDGYARIRWHKKMRSAHRVIYELLVCEIRQGKQLDHICRVRDCVRPDHLEQVTPCENILRGAGRGAVNAAKTHCIYGHELSVDNIVPSDWIKYGVRHCLTCNRENTRRNNARLRAARLAQQQGAQQ